MTDIDLRERLLDATDALLPVGPVPLPEINRRALRQRRTRRIRWFIAGTGASVASAALVATLWSPADDPGADRAASDHRAAQHGRDDEPVPISPEQQAALRDGEVTRSEYEAGFERFRTCMVREGGSVVRVSMKWRWIDFSYEESPENNRAFDLCYPLEYEQVDVEWQLAHERLR